MSNQTKLADEEKLAQEILAHVPQPACSKPAVSQNSRISAKEELAANQEAIFAAFNDNSVEKK